MTNKLDYYKKIGYKKVDGWLTQGAVELISKLNKYQIENNINGSLGEIGIHHGKLFILLYLLKRENESVLAVDLFEKQELNIDFSGKGNEEIFIDNLIRYTGSKDKLLILKDDSTNLTAEKIIELTKTKFRFFSIDGGHTDKITLNDLKLVEPLLCDGGVIILDDYFNENWPGVSIGTNIFMQNEKKIIPFLVGGNKIFFTNSKIFANDYKLQISNFFKENNIKRSDMWGFEVIIVNFQKRNFRDYLEKSFIWKNIKTKPIGKKIKSSYYKIKRIFLI